MTENPGRHSQSPSHPRLIRKLEEALGRELCHHLGDPDVIEVMLNPDGLVFVERIGGSVSQIGSLTHAMAEMVIGTVSHALNSEIGRRQPIVSGELPIGGHRFEGLLPPVVAAPTFSIRRHTSRLLLLEDYIASGEMTWSQAATIHTAITGRLNIVISGGTGSGKTTLANAIIAEMVKDAPEDRLVVLEDTTELQCSAANAVRLHTTDDIDMSRLLKSTMRLRPDRIIVGEVRDGAALTLLKAWNTGHPGGVCTLHSNSAMSALLRLEQLTAEVSHQPMQSVIGDAVDLVVSIEKTPGGRRIKEIVQVQGFAAGRYVISKPHEKDRKHA